MSQESQCPLTKEELQALLDKHNGVIRRVAMNWDLSIRRRPTEGTLSTWIKNLGCVRRVIDESEELPCSKEDIQKALDATDGNISKAAKLLRYSDGREVPERTLNGWVHRCGLKHYSDVVKARIAKQCFSVLANKAINQGDIQALKDILSKWGRFIEYEEPPAKAEITHIGNPWQKILDEVDPQRESNGNGEE